MLRTLMVGAPVMLLCLVLQSVFVTMAPRQNAALRAMPGFPQ